MLENVETTHTDTGETRIFVRRSGAGAPILLLHGFPQTHLMWRDVAPQLAGRVAGVCADPRGYVPSGCPVSLGSCVGAWAGGPFLRWFHPGWSGIEPTRSLRWPTGLLAMDIACPA